MGGWMRGMRAMRAIEVFGSRPRRRAMPREGPDRSHVWPLRLRHHCHPWMIRFMQQFMKGPRPSLVVLDPFCGVLLIRA